jgi:hypothetical protein
VRQAQRTAQTKTDEMSAERSVLRVYIPSLTRRVVAKAIEFLAVAFAVAGFSSVTHSYLAGLLIGYGCLALSDWIGSLHLGDYLARTLVISRRKKLLSSGRPSP